MKYTNLRVVLLVIIVNLLSACATFNKLFGWDDAGPDSAGSNKTEQTVTENTAEDETPDPFIAQALLLKSQDNHYLLSKVEVPKDIREQFAQALSLKQAKDYQRANELFLRISQSHPNLSGPWLQLADISQLQGQDSGAINANNEQAIKYLEQAIIVNPANYFAHNRLGSLLRVKGDFAQAKVHYQLAIKSWPGFASGYLNLGILEDLYIGEKHQALENYQLYQALIDKPERQVKGWIADLTRQLQEQKSEVLN